MEAEVFPKWLGKKIEVPLNSGIRQMECQLKVYNLNNVYAR